MQRMRGFTLIELLVVMVILGCLISLAVFSTGSASTSRELREEAQQLAAVIGLLTDEAVLENREYGLLIRAEGYRVLSYDELNNSWAPFNDQPEHKVPAWARLELELDGQPLKLAVPVKKNDDEPGLNTAASDEKKQQKTLLEPQLLILSSGELSPFRLRLSERLPKGSAFELASDGFQLPKAEVPKDQR
ncbi:MAG: type II secretion system minor pseudopilin GspH [Pseudomonas sp.]|uniref:type II secretion system minor pseudopilin GspH n=1 Tax=Pseudomonas sp. TaxID=306 RepID=UPI003391E091